MSLYYKIGKGENEEWKDTWVEITHEHKHQCLQNTLGSTIFFKQSTWGPWFLSHGVLLELTVPDVKLPPVEWGLSPNHPVEWELSPKLVTPITLETSIALSGTSCLALLKLLTLASLTDWGDSSSLLLWVHSCVSRTAFCTYKHSDGSTSVTHLALQKLISREGSVLTWFLQVLHPKKVMSSEVGSSCGMQPTSIVISFIIWGSLGLHWPTTHRKITHS